MMETTSEANISSRVIAPEDQSLSPEAASFILRWRFPTSDVERMTLLSEKANAETLTAAEQDELDHYERVGHLVAIAESKARTSLKQSSE